MRNNFKESRLSYADWGDVRVSRSIINGFRPYVSSCGVFAFRLGDAREDIENLDIQNYTIQMLIMMHSLQAPVGDSTDIAHCPYHSKKTRLVSVL